MPGIMDALLNPFQKAAGRGLPSAASPFPGSDYFPPAPAPVDASSQEVQKARQNAIMQTPAQPQRVAQQPPEMPTYSPLTDPEGPLARAGWIGALLAQGPSKSDYRQAIEDEKKKQLGEQRGAVFQKLSGLIQNGMSPQEAFMGIMATPEGMDFVINDPDPTEAIGQFLKLAGGDPTSKLREQIFKKNGLLGGDEPPAAAPAAGTDIFGAGGPETGTDIGLGGGQAPQVTTKAADSVIQVGDVTLPGGTTPQQLSDTAVELMMAGDEEGAKLAAQLANTMIEQEKLRKPPTTDDTVEYDLYVRQEKAAGRTPKDYTDWKLGMTRAANSKKTPEDLQYETRLELDKKMAEEAGKVANAARQTLPALEMAEQLADVPGGYKGTLMPVLARVATSLGMQVPQEWQEAEALQAITMQLLPLVRQPGQVSNYEQQTYAQAVPGLIQTEGGRRLVIKAMRRQAERAIAIADLWRENLGSADLSKKLAGLDTRMFTDEELAEMAKVAKLGKGAENVKLDQNGRPDLGSVVDGHEYIGGDPNTPGAWKPITEKQRSGGGGY